MKMRAYITFENGESAKGSFTGKELSNLFRDERIKRIDVTGMHEYIEWEKEQKERKKKQNDIWRHGKE